MLKRKVTTPKNASRDSHRNDKPAKAKDAPARRRFVISSKALKPETLPTEPAKGKTGTATPPASTKPTNGQTASAPSATGSSTVDLTETIKTLVHLGQEHG